MVTRQGLINDLTGLALEGSLLVRLSMRLKQIASLGKADLEILPQFLGIQPIRPGVTHKVSTPEVCNVQCRSTLLIHQRPGDSHESCGMRVRIWVSIGAGGLEVVLAFDAQIELCLTRRSNLSV